MKPRQNEAAADDWHGLLLSFGSAAVPREMAAALENVLTVVLAHIIRPTSHEIVSSPQRG